jgi:hypothetical protein
LVVVIQNTHNPRDVQVVNVNRLKPYNAGDSIASSLDRLRTQQDDHGTELEIEAILDDRKIEDRQQYLIRFKGFSARYDAWVDKDDINADELLPRYKHSRKARRTHEKGKAKI